MNISIACMGKEEEYANIDIEIEMLSFHMR